MNAPHAPSPEPAYRAEIGRIEADRDVVLGLWRDNLGDRTRHAGKFDWFYRDCPFGQPLLILLHRGATAIGCAAAGPRPMRRAGRAIRAGVLVDFTVVAAHRTLGPALQLQEAMLAAAAARFDLLYGFPNPKALPVCRRIGLEVLGTMTRHARVLRHGHYLRRVLPAWLAAPLGAAVDGVRALHDGLRAVTGPRCSARWCEQPGVGVDALWASAPHDAGVLAVRDRAMLAWRFARSPLEEVRFLEVSDRSGALVAWFACRDVDDVLHVRDFWSTGGNLAMPPGVIHALLRAARRAGSGAVSLELIAAPALLASWRAAGFRPRESRPLVGKWLHGDAEPMSLFLTSMDEDE